MKDYIEALREIKKEKKNYKITLSREEILVLVNEFDRLNGIINETRRILGEYRHFSTPTEEQNSENEEIVDKAYIKLHSNLQETKELGVEIK